MKTFFTIYFIFLTVGIIKALGERKKRFVLADAARLQRDIKSLETEIKEEEKRLKEEKKIAEARQKDIRKCVEKFKDLSAKIEYEQAARKIMVKHGKLSEYQEEIIAAKMDTLLNQMNDTADYVRKKYGIEIDEYTEV